MRQNLPVGIRSRTLQKCTSGSNGDAHIPTWGTQLTTPVVKDDYAKVNIKTTLVVPSGKQFDAYRIVTELKDKDGKVVTTDEKSRFPFDDNIFSQELVVSRPALWSPETLFFIRLFLMSMKVITEG